MNGCSCFLNKGILRDYDDSIRYSLQKILNIQLEVSAWNLCTLPINLGGLGIKLASEVALPAFLSSSYASISTVKSLVPLHIREDQGQVV